LNKNINGPRTNARLLLKDGNIFEGTLFGKHKSVAGEVVFNTGMVGYPETLTDPSYKGQILVMTYPLVGNYGIPPMKNENDIPENFESDKIQIQALVVSEESKAFSHWNAIESLDQWLKRFNIPGLYGIDTRRLTKILREHGTMLGKIEFGKDKVAYYDPDVDNLISKVTVPKVEKLGKGKKRILLIDCGCKKSILSNLLDRKVTVLRVPYDYDVNKEDYDGVVISNGPGNPVVYKQLVNSARVLIQKQVPTLGICMGHQILSLAAEAKTYKLK